MGGARVPTSCPALLTPHLFALILVEDSRSGLSDLLL